MYQLFVPATPLRAYIDSYWLLQLQADATNPLQENIFIDGKADIIFNYGAAYERQRLFREAQVCERLPNSNLDGPRRYPVAIVQTGSIHLVGVRFKAGGLAAFLDIPVQEVCNETLTITDGFGVQGRDLEGRLYDHSKDAADQVDLLNQFFMTRLRISHAYQFVRHTAEQIERSGGAARIHDISRDVGYSIRTLDRLFHRYYGFAPKYYARIARFQRVLSLLIQPPDQDFLQIGLKTGYYDQSHFTKEFQAFSGLRPEEYRARLSARRDTPAPNLVQFLQEA